MQNQSNLLLTSEQLLKASKVTRIQTEGWIEDLDPLLEGNMKVIYTKTIPIEIRQVNQQGNQIGVKQMLNFRFYVRQTIHQSEYGQLNIEINNDADIFFTYICKVDQKKYEKIKKQQGLNFSFNNLLSMLVKQLQLCDKQMNQYSAIFYMNQGSNPRLDFIQNIEYKRIELISFEFQQLEEQLLKDYVTYRFTKLKKMNEILLNKTRTVISEVKLKNPKLLKSIMDKKQQKKP